MLSAIYRNRAILDKLKAAVFPLLFAFGAILYYDREVIG